MSVADEALPADAVIVARLRQRDEAMFAALIDAWSPGLLRAARAFVADEHAAQDVVQETWLGVLRGIATFEGRSSVRTWVYRILAAVAWPSRPRPTGGRPPSGSREKQTGGRPASVTAWFWWSRCWSTPRCRWC
ncbi:RNA polymerase sigma factor [Dactylosporangium darangshiense]|uniref:RNA polymerase sigma factor n=1 Tax=Dactylosporangium darangshiense TaxID=579108 RepID=UPI0036455548